MSRRERRIARQIFGATLPELARMGKLAHAGRRLAEHIFPPGTRRRAAEEIAEVLLRAELTTSGVSLREAERRLAFLRQRRHVREKQKQH